MTSNNTPIYSVGDLVWCKMRGHPPWPATITTSPANCKDASNAKYAVMFFGTRETAQVKATELFDYKEYRHSFEVNRKIKGFNEAVQEIRAAAGIQETIQEEASEECSSSHSAEMLPSVPRSRKPSTRLSVSDFVLPRSRRSSVRLSVSQAEQLLQKKSPLSNPMLGASNNTRKKLRTDSTCSNGMNKRTKRVSYSDSKFGLDLLDYDPVLLSSESDRSLIHSSDPLVAMNACLASNSLSLFDDQHSDDERLRPRRRTRSRVLEDFMLSPGKSPCRDRSRSISTGGRSRLASGLSDFDDLLESVHSIFNPSELMAAIDQLPSEESDRPLTPEEPLPMPPPLKKCYACECQCELIGLKWRCTSKLCAKWNGVHQPYIVDNAWGMVSPDRPDSSSTTRLLEECESIKKEAAEKELYEPFSSTSLYSTDQQPKQELLSPTKFQPVRFQNDQPPKYNTVTFGYEQHFSSPQHNRSLNSHSMTHPLPKSVEGPSFSNKVEKTPPVEQNGLRLCVFCNGQVRPQMCGGNKHRWRCVDKKCRKWYGWVKVNDEIPKDLGKKGRWKDLVLKVQGRTHLAAEPGSQLYINSEQQDQQNNLYLDNDNNISMLCETAPRRIGRPPKLLLVDDPNLDKIRTKFPQTASSSTSTLQRPKRKYQRRKKIEEPENQRPLSPLTLRQQSYEPSTMEKRGRWWMSERSNMYREQDQDESAGASVLKAAAAMRLIGNAMYTLANTKADEAGSVNEPKLSQYVDHNNKCSFMVEFDGKMHLCGAKTDKHNVGRHFRDKHTDYQGKPICQLAPIKTTARRQLAFFFATSTASIRLIEKEWFKKVLHRVPDFIVPCRRTLVAEMEAEVQRVLDTIRKKVTQSSGRFSITTDIATTPNGHYSFLSLIAHFIFKGVLQVAALDVIVFDGSHTGEYTSRVGFLSFEENFCLPQRLQKLSSPLPHRSKNVFRFLCITVIYANECTKLS